MRKVRRKQLGADASDHVNREATALKAIEHNLRAAQGAASSGQCGSAYEKYGALNYWMGVWETHQRSIDVDEIQPLTDIHARYTRVKRAFRDNCLVPHRRARR